MSVRLWGIHLMSDAIPNPIKWHLISDSTFNEFSNFPLRRNPSSLGKTTKLLQYLAATPSGAAEATAYSYDPSGRMTGMSDPDGNTWTSMLTKQPLRPQRLPSVLLRTKRQGTRPEMPFRRKIQALGPNRPSQLAWGTVVSMCSPDQDLAIESKVGRTSSSSNIRLQIAKISFLSAPRA